VRSAILAGLGDAGFHAITQDVALEFREHGEHAGQHSLWRAIPLSSGDKSKLNKWLKAKATSL
jgi:hypothetical protein